MTEPVLIAGAQQLGIELSHGQAAQMLRVLDELDDWNQRMNLTAIRERGAQITKHLLDSLSIQPYLRGTRIVRRRAGTAGAHPTVPATACTRTTRCSRNPSTSCPCTGAAALPPKAPLPPEHGWSSR